MANTRGRAEGIQEWRPIETAPKDGTDMLVMDNHAPGLPSGTADECWAGNTAVAAFWREEGEGLEDGEWVCYMDRIIDPGLHFKPTHWMPLPAPPRETQGHEGGQRGRGKHDEDR